MANKLNIDMDDVIRTYQYQYPTFNLEKDVLIKEYKRLINVAFSFEEDTELDGQMSLFEDQEEDDLITGDGGEIEAAIEMINYKLNNRKDDEQ